MQEGDASVREQQESLGSLYLSLLVMFPVAGWLIGEGFNECPADATDCDLMVLPPLFGALGGLALVPVVILITELLRWWRAR